MGLLSVTRLSSFLLLCGAMGQLEPPAATSLAEELLLPPVNLDKDAAGGLCALQTAFQSSSAQSSLLEKNVGNKQKGKGSEGVPAEPAVVDEVQGMLLLDQIMAANGGKGEGHSNECPEQTIAMNNLASSPEVKTICETGFNGGHSSLRWLLHSNAHVYSFDLAAHPYSLPAAQWMSQTFPDRFKITWGDSTVTLPIFAQQNPNVKCDVVFVDGGHLQDIATADLKNFRVMAQANATLMSSRVMIDDTYCSPGWCLGPTTAWQEAVGAGIVQESSKWSSADGQRGWAEGRYVGI